MKRILFLLGGLNQGGAERQAVSIALKLKERGYDPEFFCFQEGNFYEPILRQNDINIVRRTTNGFLKRMIVIRRFIRKNNYDAVISFMNFIGFFNDVAAIGPHKWKVITSERGSARERASFSWKLFGLFQYYSDYVVCNSVNSYDFWTSRFPQYKSRLLVIYNAVTIKSPHLDVVVNSDRKLHIVIAARMEHVKNPVCLIDALLLMNESERNKIRIDWYGAKGNASEEVEGMIDRFKLNSTIILHNATEEISSKMLEADVVALFSKHEGLPNAICEAMMLEKPIIMTKVSDYSVLVDENNGALCEVDSPQSIKNALLYMSTLSQDELGSMGQKSRIKAEKLFSPEIVIKKWIDIIEK